MSSSSNSRSLTGKASGTADNNIDPVISTDHDNSGFYPDPIYDA